MKILKNDIDEAREILGKEFMSVSDKDIEQMLCTFRLLARMLINDNEKEGL